MLMVRIYLKELAVFGNGKVGFFFLYICVCYTELGDRRIFLGKVPVLYFKEKGARLLVILALYELVRLFKRTLSIEFLCAGLLYSGLSGAGQEGGCGQKKK
jgi:hypothetical protein